MQQPPQRHWIFARWYYTLAVSAFVLMVVAVAIQLVTPKPPEATPTFGAARPGDTFSSSKQKELGEPLETSKTKKGDTEYLYASDFAVHPNQVHVDAKNKIQFVKEFVLPDPKHTLTQYVAEYGQPDFVLYDTGSPDSVRAHVFLEAGLVVVAHIDGDVVEQKWYFEPTTKELFLAGYGDSLSESGSGPESFPEL
jgi:hypothetical protein